ncbi:hypothetical protein [Chryseobacterium terrae]|uniref:Uncharacterized protein n=1 Tax=Chryseobacterium terrae TaxID=3163299 RepID=A0ABW8Y4W8_9FLAO
MAQNFNDKQIGIQASGRLTAALRGKTRGFANHYNGVSREKSLREATAVPRYKNYGLVRNGNRNTYLRAISLKMSKHGYIRHYGVDVSRSAGSRERNGTVYHFRNHMMKQTAKPFIDEVIRRSGVVNFVSEKIAESRGEEIAQNLAVSISNFQRS